MVMPLQPKQQVSNDRPKKLDMYIPVSSLNMLAIKVKSPQFLLQSSIALGNFSLFMSKDKGSTHNKAPCLQSTNSTLTAPPFPSKKHRAKTTGHPDVSKL